jgi:HSP20 family protein
MLMQYSPVRSMWDRPLAGASLFDDVFENFFNLTRSVSAGPRFVSRETDDGWVMTAEAPGVSSDDLGIVIEDGVLTIRGERRLEEPEGYRALRRERSALRFARSFTLSDRMDGDNVEATLENGLLTLRIPRRPETKPRQITITCS